MKKSSRELIDNAVGSFRDRFAVKAIENLQDPPHAERSLHECWLSQHCQQCFMRHSAKLRSLIGERFTPRNQAISAPGAFANRYTGAVNKTNHDINNWNEAEWFKQWLALANRA